MEQIKAMLDKVIQADTLADRQIAAKRLLSAIASRFNVDLNEAQYHMDVKSQHGPVLDWSEYSVLDIQQAESKVADAKARVALTKATLDADKTPAAKADNEAANLALKDAEKELARVKTLPRSAIDARQLKVNDARARVETAQAELNAQPAPGTPEARAKLDIANAALAAAEAELAAPLPVAKTNVLGTKEVPPTPPAPPITPVNP